MILCPKSVYYKTSDGYLLNVSQVSVFSPAKYPTGQKFYYAHLPDGSLIPLSKGDFKAMIKQFDNITIFNGLKD